MMSGKTGLLLKAAVSIALLAVLVSRVPLAGLAATLARADPLLLTLAAAAAFGGWAVNTLKWWQLLAALHPGGRYSDLLALNFIGMFYSLVLPGQISGEVVKGLRLSRHGVPGGAVATSILVDRLTGLAALALLGLSGLALGPELPATALAAWLAVAVLAMAVLPLVAARGGVNLPFAGTGGWRGRLAGALGAVNGALFTYRRRPWLLVGALALSLVFQGIVSVSNYLAARALGIDIALPALVWIVAAVSLINLLPVSLGGLGVREGAYVLLLSQNGVPVSSGLALALVVFGIILLQGLAGGALEAGVSRPAPVAGQRPPLG